MSKDNTMPVRSPEKLLEPNNFDIAVVEKVEAYIDSRLDSFDGGDITVQVYERDVLEQECWTVRQNVREKELRRRLLNAGWKQVHIQYKTINPKDHQNFQSGVITVKLSQYEPPRYSNPWD